MAETTTITSYGSKDRKVYFYSIMCTKDGYDEEQEFPYTKELFEEFQRIYFNFEYRNADDDKWYAIESVQENSGRYNVVLESCKYNYRPNLIDVNSRRERVSPKTPNEGDKEKTHALLYGSTILYEKRKNGTGIGIFAKYLDQVWDNIRNSCDSSILSIDIKQLIDEDFVDIINGARRISNIKFHVDSKISGSEFYNFSEDNNVRDTYTIEMKAKRKATLSKEEVLNSIEKFFLGGKKKIQKVTADIVDENNNRRIINTDEIAKQTTLNVSKNKEGEIDSDEMFLKMGSLI